MKNNVKKLIIKWKKEVDLIISYIDKIDDDEIIATLIGRKNQLLDNIKDLEQILNEVAVKEDKVCVRCKKQEAFIGDYCYHCHTVVFE